MNLHIANKDWTQLASYLVSILRQSNVVCMHRKYTLRNILHHNLAIFTQVFLALNKISETFFGVNILSKIIPLKVQSQLTAIFQHQISNPSAVYNRLDGRKRIFVENDELLHAEQALFEGAMDDFCTNENQRELEKVLFERISPINVANINNSYWHIDSHRDQLKVVLPIQQMHAQNALMRYLQSISHIADYNNEIWHKLHTIYKTSGVLVSKQTILSPVYLKLKILWQPEPK